MTDKKLLLASLLITLIAHNQTISMGSDEPGSSGYPPRHPQQEHKETNHATNMRHNISSLGYAYQNHYFHDTDALLAQALQEECDALEQKKFRSISPTYEMVSLPTASSYLEMHRKKQEEILAKKIESMSYLASLKNGTQKSPDQNENENILIIPKLLAQIHKQADLCTHRVHLLNEGKLNEIEIINGMNRAYKIFRINPKKIMHLIENDTLHNQAIWKQLLEQANDKVQTLHQFTDDSIENRLNNLQDLLLPPSSLSVLEYSTHNHQIQKPTIDLPAEFDKTQQYVHAIFEKYTGQITLKNITMILDIATHANKHLEQFRTKLMPNSNGFIYASEVQRQQEFESTRNEILTLIRQGYNVIDDNDGECATASSVCQKQISQLPNEREQEDIERAIKLSLR